MPLDSDVSSSNDVSTDHELLLAVDTGGSKTAAWLVEHSGAQAHRVLGEARTSAGNPLSVGFERSTQAIHDAVLRCQKSATNGGSRISRAVMSIAGAANRDMSRRFVDWAKSN